MNESKSKAALVTGGGTGVGRAAALQFAKRGFDVAINYSRSQDDAEQTAVEVRELGQRAIVVQCDVASDEQAVSMIETVRREFGRLDILVNNAGMTYFVEHTDLDAMSEEKWDRILAVNLKGAFFVSRAAIPLLRESGGGAIVNVASVAGVAGAGSSIAYAASKGGLITMTKSLAKAFAPEIRVNAVCPGVILSRWLGDHQDMIDKAINITPLERASTPDDIADVITFLACDAGMMTGQALVVDGGRTM
ncbi:MAG: SDR family oxidoreductase [Planctomycetaceae bacterium]|nr:SDR family oxidoreductase [Planctomycetales bacterium]MCB9873969.1 SDR family oxidoreductase [Planctomycetaceae bacterium]MCB9938568.1 SDR family oxidoreductase [Planctomycetaceae bacterium]